MPHVTFQEHDQLGEIVIDNPPQNFFSGDVLTDLGVAIKDAAKSNVRAVLLRAEGDDYSAGADASVFGNIGKDEASALAAAVIGYIHAIETLMVPTVALIQHQCYAGAVETCMTASAAPYDRILFSAPALTRTVTEAPAFTANCVA